MLASVAQNSQVTELCSAVLTSEGPGSRASPEPLPLGPSFQYQWGLSRSMAKFLRHLFICTNERSPDDPRGSCTARGSAAVAAALKEKAHACGLKRIVRVNKAGCLDQCAKGVTVVVYPEGVWYGGVRVEDVDEIVERHLVGGEPVRRLEIPAQELTGKEPPLGLGRETTP